jgi:hypothetical protein
MDRLSTLLSKILRKHGIKDEAEASLIVHAATQWFAMNLPASEGSITVQKLEGGTLLVACAQAPLQQECFARQEDLLQYLREKYPQIPIERIRFVHR